jgi:hypothetical protein
MNIIDIVKLGAWFIFGLLLGRILAYILVYGLVIAGISYVVIHELHHPSHYNNSTDYFYHHPASPINSH